jgi:hypothetical protein
MSRKTMLFVNLGNGGYLSFKARNDMDRVMLVAAGYEAYYVIQIG